MPHNNNKILGILLIVLGAALFMASAGKYLVEILLIVVSMSLINFGLKMLGQPSIWRILADWIASIKFE